MGLQKNPQIQKVQEEEESLDQEGVLNSDQTILANLVKPAEIEEIVLDDEYEEELDLLGLKALEHD